jgi:cbb3-type cytochrome oxidase subunit 3
MEVNWYVILLSFALIAAFLIFMNKQHQKEENESNRKLKDEDKTSDTEE